ncbi:MAG: ParB/RepB/Spo0J family partition protein [Clostridia bacterium]|nr:ParB/RepB/Spo0J family partition protein [Clostridia bacterium]
MNSVKMDIGKLHPFEGHPFKVQDNEEMDALVESIQSQGILTPLIVRKKENTTDEYEIISGHRRYRAAVKAGLETVPAFIYALDRNAAAIMLVDCNLHRERLLPSEKAFAYKMKLDAMKHQGYRSDLSSDQVGPKLESAEMMALVADDSKSQIRRYIRLTNLIPELMQKVDDGQIALTPAVELSFLQEHEQRQLLDEMGRTDSSPNLSQSQRLRIFSRDGRLSPDVICAIMSEEKANQKERLRIPVDRVKQFFPKSYTTARMEEEIIKLCEAQYRRRMSREAR